MAKYILQTIQIFRFQRHELPRLDLIAPPARPVSKYASQPTRPTVVYNPNKKIKSEKQHYQDQEQINRHKDTTKPTTLTTTRTTTSAATTTTTVTTTTAAQTTPKLTPTPPQTTPDNKLDTATTDPIAEHVR